MTEGKCLECGSPTQYSFLAAGPLTFCSEGCGVRHRAKKDAYEDIELGPAGKGEWQDEF